MKVLPLLGLFGLLGLLILFLYFFVFQRKKIINDHCTIYNKNGKCDLCDAGYTFDNIKDRKCVKCPKNDKNC